MRYFKIEFHLLLPPYPHSHTSMWTEVFSSSSFFFLISRRGKKEEEGIEVFLNNKIFLPVRRGAKE